MLYLFFTALKVAGAATQLGFVKPDLVIFQRSGCVRIGGKAREPRDEQAMMR